ncbi:hypothetical protein ACROYT_G016633 [Oculina patagonica]
MQPQKNDKIRRIVAYVALKRNDAERPENEGEEDGNSGDESVDECDSESDDEASMYADDTSITSSGIDTHSIEPKLNEDLKKLENWLDANRLSINVVKTEYMIIGSRKRLNHANLDLNLKIGDTNLKRVEKTVSLGVTLDENLTWKEHVSNISKKVSKGLGVLMRTREILPNDSLNQIYKSIIQPHFDYCSPVWHTCDKGLRTKLQRLQNRAARIITRSGYEVRSADLRKDLGWQPLEDRWYQQKVTTMYKIANNLAPHSLTRNFTPVRDTHHYETRGCHINLCVPKPNTEFLKRSLAYNGVVAWNALPVEIKESKDLNSFKRIVK